LGYLDVNRGAPQVDAEDPTYMSASSQMQSVQPAYDQAGNIVPQENPYAMANSPGVQQTQAPYQLAS